MWKFIKSNWQPGNANNCHSRCCADRNYQVIKPAHTGILSQTLKDSTWVPPSLFIDNLLEGEERELVIYGEDIVANTSRYFGPHGSVAAITNGMNCQNCHLNAGRKNWGNNYSTVYSTYPKFRERSGSTETIYKRVSDCFERSLNGTAPDSASKNTGRFMLI
jgi:thiosulfate dehydrogenase